MIAIGTPPPTRELFGYEPKEPIAKLSEKNDPVMHLNGIDPATKIAKINRIVLSRTAVVKLLEAESPSRIWVQLTNNITETTLTIKEPKVLTPKENVTLGDYALAPVEERIYKRCRVEGFQQSEDGTKKLAKIFFIDDATKALVNPMCLCELDEHYMFFPWQAIQVSIFGLFPGNLCDVEQTPRWSFETCEKLRELLKSFQFLRVECVLSSHVFNDYARPTVCNLYGLDNELDIKKTANIADILVSLSDSPIFTEPVFDAAHHRFFRAEDNQVETPAFNEVQMRPAVKIGMKDEEKLDKEGEQLFDDKVDADARDWDPELCQVPMFTKEDLESFVDSSTGRIMMCVEGPCTKSPYEWYARPIKKTWAKKDGEVVTQEEYSKYDPSELTETNEVDWMINGNEELLAEVEQLDNYYSNPKNRRPLLAEEIVRLQKAGRDVYAVCAVNEEKSDYTGEWQRVQILSCDTFALVRFLDSGGRDMVLTSSLYRIHVQHCAQPPKCLHLAMHGVKPSKERSDSKWVAAEISRFKLLLREDVPILIDSREIELLNSARTISRPEDPPYLAKHVFFVKDFYACGESVGMLYQFVGNQVGQAVQDSTKPVPWISPVSSDDSSFVSVNELSLSEA